VYRVNRLQLKDELLYTSITLRHEGKYIVVDDVIIDTGAFHTIIAPNYLEDLDVAFSDEDELVKASGYGGTVSYSVRKKMDSIECEDIRINDIKIDFGEIDPNERVNGLIGLDFLRKAGVMLDLVDLVMYKKST
jgi:predicted aspartyl protease